MNPWKDDLSETDAISRYRMYGDGFVVSHVIGWQGMTEVNETALFKHENYFVLEGDWKKQYEPLIDKGFEACKAFYDENKENNERLD